MTTPQTDKERRLVETDRLIRGPEKTDAWSRYLKWRKAQPPWRAQMGSTALIAGLASWFMGPLFGWDGLFMGIGATVAGGIGLGVRERRGQAVAGFILGLLYLLSRLVTVRIVPIT